MDFFLAILFWCSVFLVVYPYVIYPVLMCFIGKVRHVPRPEPDELPSVSVVVAAYNEAEWIGRKIESTLSQDYPVDRLEVVVVSDASTDATDKIVSGFKDPRVKLLVQEERKGKSVALNRGVYQAKGDILVFTDANALFGLGSIRALAEHFSDPKVGLVSGQGLYACAEHNTGGDVANGYVRFEALIKTGESALGFIGGADGAIYAIRRELFRDLAPAQVNDLLHPITTALAGYSSRFDPRAYTVEPPSSGAAQEFHRHIRIIAQGFAIVSEVVPDLISQKRWRGLWVLLSHRLLRWLSIVGLLGLLSISLLSYESFYKVILAGQSLFYLTAVIGWLAQKMNWPTRLLVVPTYFFAVSLAGIFGFFSFLRSGVQGTWNPRGVIIHH